MTAPNGGYRREPLPDSERERHPDPEQLHFDVDCSGQALVWAITAGQNGTELLEALHGQQERREAGGVPTGSEALREIRKIEHLKQAYEVAKGLAEMWAMTCTVQPYTETAESDDSGQAGKS